MENNNKKTYWPHMIVGFLILGFTLSYWTVKSASNIPVQEDDDYMMRYQQADININEILKHKRDFDNVYSIELENVETMVMTDNVHSNRAQPNPVKLTQGANSFRYSVKDKNGVEAKDANVTFVLTRPHTKVDDQVFENVAFYNGAYTTPSVEITKPGRYMLQLRVQIEDKIGFLETAAYLKP